MSTIREAADKFSEGMRLRRAMDYERAVDAFTEAITLNPNYANAYRYRAELYQELGRDDDAIADMEMFSSFPESARQETEQIHTTRVPQRNEIEKSTAKRREAKSTYSTNDGGANTMEDFLTFRKMITPVLIQIAFWLAIVSIVIFGIAGLASGNGLIKLGGLALLIFGPLYARVVAELFILVFRINETLTDIKNNTGRRNEQRSSS